MIVPICTAQAQAMIVIHSIAVFPFLADVVNVKKGSGSTAHWSIDFIRLSGWMRRCFTLLITRLDIDGIGQNWEDNNMINLCGVVVSDWELFCKSWGAGLLRERLFLMGSIKDPDSSSGLEPVRRQSFHPCFALGPIKVVNVVILT